MLIVDTHTHTQLAFWFGERCHFSPKRCMAYAVYALRGFTSQCQQGIRLARIAYMYMCLYGVCRGGDA